MFVLNKDSQQNICETMGISVEQIVDMDFEDIDAYIAKKVGHTIRDYIAEDSLIGRGQVYSEMDRFLTSDELNEGLNKHDGRKSAFVRKTVFTV